MYIYVYTYIYICIYWSWARSRWLWALGCGSRCKEEGQGGAPQNPVIHTRNPVSKPRPAT